MGCCHKTWQEVMVAWKKVAGSAEMESLRLYIEGRANGICWQIGCGIPSLSCSLKLLLKVLMIDTQHYVTGHLWDLFLASLHFVLNTSIAFARTEEYCFCAFLFLDCKFLLPLWGIPTEGAAILPGPRTTHTSILLHTTASVHQLWLHCNLWCLFPPDSAPSCNWFMFSPMQ